jgi:hypothetical protein
MKNKINVYLQKPLNISDSIYYKYLVRYSPKGVQYLGKGNNNAFLVKGKNFKLIFTLKQVIKFFLKIFNFSRPNVYLSNTILLNIKKR